MAQGPAKGYFDSRPIQEVIGVDPYGNLPAPFDPSGGIVVNNETTEPWDDGPAVHLAAAFPGIVTGTPNGTNAIINLLPATASGGTFVSPLAPVSGLTMQGFPSMLDVRHWRGYIDNATSAIITNVQLQSSLVVGTTTASIGYAPIGSVNIAAGVGLFVDIPVPRGLLPNVNLIATTTANSSIISVQSWFYTQPQYMGTKVDRSGVVASGGTAVTAMSANPARRYLFIENSGPNPLWFNWTVTATTNQPSVQLLPGAFWEESAPNFVSPELISIVGAVASQGYTAKEA